MMKSLKQITTSLRNYDAMKIVWAAILLAMITHVSGCNYFGYIAQGLAGEKDRTSKYTAEYRGLEGKRFVVLVTTDSQTVHEAPTAPKALNQMVSRKIIKYVDQTISTPYEDIEKFETANRYWQISPYSEIYEKLDVERLVHIELLSFSTHEPGNEQIWQGSAAARVCIAEAENDDPDNFAYCQTVNAKFPPDRPVGLLDANHDLVQRGLVVTLSSEIVNLFRDYEKVEK